MRRPAAARWRRRTAAADPRWEAWHARTARLLLEAQRPDGAWPDPSCAEYGTAAAIAVLCVPRGTTPLFDALAARGTSGLSVPVLPGITPGSGPGHLGLFGYDPLAFKIGRGALEATGIGFELGPHDVAARGNFCTLDSAGLITDSPRRWRSTTRPMAVARRPCGCGRGRARVPGGM